jgi:hypothetical protein
MDGRIAAIFGYDLANVILSPFLLPTHHHFVIFPFTKRMIFSLMSLKSFSIWPILMTDLLLHIFLHLLIYNEVQTVTKYSTKKQQHWQNPPLYSWSGLTVLHLLATCWIFFLLEEVGHLGLRLIPPPLLPLGRTAFNHRKGSIPYTLRRHKVTQSVSTSRLSTASCSADPPV